MNYLLYCIFPSTVKQNTVPLLGIQGQAISIINHDGLSAAISQLTDLPSTPDISQLLAYEKVVDVFHREHTVIPMRYGCLFETKAHIIRFLEEHSKQYKILLKELDGCVEMGIRIILPEEPTASNVANHPLQSDISNNPTATNTKYTSGQAYLAAQRTRYAEEDQILTGQDVVMDNICSQLKDLFVRSCKEKTGLFAANNVVSIYFLLPRSALNSFRQKFRQIEQIGSEKLLLSGPWPPYNFVLSSQLPNQEL